MPNYVPKSFKRLNYVPEVAQKCPQHKHSLITRGRKLSQQLINPVKKELPSHDTKQMQSIAVVLLHFARALFTTGVLAFNEIVTVQAKPME